MDSRLTFCAVVDATIEAKADAERNGKQVADVLVLSDKQWVMQKAASNWYHKADRT